MNIPVNPTQIQAQTIRTNPSEAPKLAPSQQPDAITIYLDLEAEARSARDITALRQVFVNSTRRLADYDQAFLLEPAGRHGNWMISAASSVSNIDRDGGLARAIEGVINNPKRLAHKTNAEARVDHFPKDAADWNIDFSECDFGYGLWLPLKDREGTPQAGLLALKQENWRPQSVTMLDSLTAQKRSSHQNALAACCPKEGLARRFARTDRCGVHSGAAHRACAG